MLLANRRYTHEAIQKAEQVSNEVNVRHSKWLISMKYLLDQANVDNLLSLQGRYCEDVIFSEQERVTRNQRILLECEQAKVVEKREQVKAKQQTHKRVIIEVSRHAEHLIIDKLLNSPIEKLFSGIPNFDHLASFAYSPSLSFSKLSTLTTLSHQLSSSILDLVSNPKFCERIGKSSKSVTDAKVAIGQLGIENCRLLFPVLMARPMLKWSDVNTKLKSKLSRRVLDSMDWPANAMYIKNAVIEDLDNVPVDKRSLAGAALAQGRAFSIYDGLNRSSAFVEKHKPYWFAQVQMPGAALKEIQTRMPGKLTLSM